LVLRVMPPLDAVLPRSFYERGAVAVARGLLGKVLVYEGGSEVRAARIVETEAYVGPHDLACHASRGRTSRTEVMFGPGGHAYLYLVYGMHWCFNAVTGREGTAAAVLVRGVEPLAGISSGVRTDGPGRLTKALGIGRNENRADLTRGPLRIVEGSAPAGRIRRGPRVGVDYAGGWASRPLRFWVEGSPGVSRVPRSSGASASRARGDR
jgi:DNA-3-methyladenine glycosylase